MEIQTYNVNLAGQPLRLRSTHDQNTVDEILSTVESYLDQAKGQTSRYNATLLTCLHLAEELYLLKKKAKQELDSLEVLARDHLSRLEISDGEEEKSVSL